MAEKNISVRLSARVDAYVAAMRKADAATGLTRKSLRNLQRVGGQMQNVGRQMTTFVSLPIAAVGFAATRSAMQFEEAFAQMQGLANVPADEIENLKDQVLDLAGDTAKAPQELADALFFAASSGLDTAEAMDALTFAAQASAAGMGPVSDIVGLVASALNAYGTENINAAEATDILTAAVREGRAEPDELAASLGRVLPVAAELGVGFDEVGGAVAFMSNIFGDAEQTTTRLNGVLRAILDPTEQGRQALIDMGTSAEELRQVTSEDGLLGALELLREKGFLENQEALGALFDDSRALEGALVLLRDESGNLVPIMESVADSTGALGDAFATATDTDAFRMRQALAQIQTAMITLGETLLPIAADIAGAIADMAEFFGDLPGPVQGAIVALAGVAAAAGPLAFIAGSILRSWGTIIGTFRGGVGIVGRMTGALAGLGLAVGIGVIAYRALTENSRRVAARTKEVGAALDDATGQAFAYAQEALSAGDALDGLAIAQHALSIALTTTGEDGEALIQTLGSIGVQSDDAFTTLFDVSQRGLAALKDIAMQAEFTGMEAEILTAAVLEMGEGWPLAGGRAQAAMQRIADAFGITKEEVQAFLLENQAFLQGLEDVQDAAAAQDLEALATQFLNSAVAADESTEALVEEARARAESNDVADSSLDVYNELIGLISELPDAERNAALEALDLADATGKAGAAGQDAADGMGAAGDSIDAFSEDAEAGARGAEMLREAVEAMDFDAAAQSADAWRTAVDLAFQVEDNITAAENLTVAMNEFHEQVHEVGKGLDETSTHFDVNTEAGLRNRDAIIDVRDRMFELAARQLATGKSTEEVTTTTEGYIDALRREMDQAGFTEAEIDNLLFTYGLTPETIETVIKLHKDELAKQKIRLYIDLLDDIPPNVASEVIALIDEGRFQDAEARLQQLGRDQTVTYFVNIIANPIGNFGDFGFGGFAHGGFVTHPTFAALGERGDDELVLPLTRPGRMAELLSDPMAGPAWDAIGNLMAASSFGGQPPTPAGGDINVTVHNNGRDLTGDDIARAIARHRVAA